MVEKASFENEDSNVAYGKSVKEIVSQGSKAFKKKSFRGNNVDWKSGFVPKQLRD